MNTSNKHSENTSTTNTATTNLSTPNKTDDSGISSVESPAFTADKQEGATLLVQQRPETVTPQHKPLVVERSRAFKTLNDSSWNLESMLQRNTLVASIPWSTTHPTGQVLAVFDLPEHLLTNDITSEPFLRFQKWRNTKIRVSFQTVGNAFTQGRVICFFQPTQSPQTQIAKKYVSSPTFFTATSLQHVFLNPQSSTTAALEIPFSYNRTWLDLRLKDSLGQLYVMVFNPLLSASTGPPTVSIKVFSSIQGSEFRIPLPGSVTYTQSNLERTFATYHSGLWQGLEDIVDKIMPVNLVGDIIGGILDKPQIATQPEPLVRRVKQYTNHAVNSDFVDKMQLYPEGMSLCDTEHFNNSEETNFIQLLKDRTHYVGTTQWDTSVTAGSILTTQWVAPVSYYPKPNIPSSSGPFGVDMMSAVSLMFTHWRGSIVYTFDVVASNYQEGRLDVTFQPNSILGASTPDYPAAMSQYNTSVQLKNGSASFQVVCPFLSDIPWRRVPDGSPVTDDPASDAAKRSEDFYSGSWSLRVSSQLTCPQSVAPSVAINIFCHAGDDFELANMTPHNSSISFVGLTTNDGTVTTHAMQQSGETRSSYTPAQINEKPSSQDKVMLCAGSGHTSEAKVTHFADKPVTDFLDMLKRYSSLRTVVVDPSLVTNKEIRTQIQQGARPFIVPIFRWSDPLAFEGTLFNRIMPFYRNWRGPLVFKTQLARANNTTVAPGEFQMVIFFMPTPENRTLDDMQQYAGMLAKVTSGAYDERHSGPNFPRVFASNEQIAEYLVPYMGLSPTSLVPKLFDNIPLSRASNFADFTVYAGITFNNALTTQTWQLTTEMAIGDEFHLGVFVGVPTIVAQCDATGTSLLPDSWYPLGKYSTNTHNKHQK
jgi:hypothetical protein